MKRGNGAIIVKDQRVVSTGYNGTPAGLINCNQGGCRRCNRNVHQGLELDKCLCLHAEESAVLEAGRPRTLGATIYTTSFPCQLCTRKIIQAGIVRVVYNKNYDSVLSREMFSFTDIEIVQLNPETGVMQVTKRSGTRTSSQRQTEDLLESPLNLKRMKTSDSQAAHYPFNN